MTTTRWEAPRIGYLLTSAMAGQRYDEASATWRELDESAQCDVITRAGGAGPAGRQEAGIPLQIDFTGLADTSCTEARPAAEAAYAGTGPWQPPQCPHCRELVASALAEIQLQAGVAAGMPPSYVDLICRGKAVGGAA